MTYFQIENKSHAILLSSLHLRYCENSGKEPLESRGFSFTAPNFNIIKMFSSTQGSTDLLENSNEFVKNTGGVGFSRLLRLQVAGLT